MQQLSESEKRAIQSLGNNANFVKVVGWMARSLNTQDQVNRNLSDNLLYRGQGKAIELADIIDTCNQLGVPIP
ncbi:MAG: hypothetical protein KAS93_07945 [Gammaproteobacteria bacterium]|nr:hypothetical protein [Gammaproteobacteria bacterium]